MRVWITKSPTPFLLALVFGVLMVSIWWTENEKVRRSLSYFPATAVLSAVYYSPDSGGENEFFYEGVIEKCGTKFKSFRLSYGNVNTHESYNKFVEDYPVGSSLDVFVSPDEPTEVVVSRGNLSWVFRAILGVGLVIVGASVLGLARALRFR